GKDTMTGGGNDDILRFLSASESAVGTNADIIADFDDAGDDRIDLSSIYSGTLIYRGTEAITGDHQVNVTASGTDVIVHVNLSGSLAPDMEIRLADTTLASMAGGDFIL